MFIKYTQSGVLKMSSEHIETRRKIKAISELKTFNDLLERSTLNPKQKELMNMYYLQDMSFNEIGEILGIEEVTAKVWHNKALKKLKNLF